MLRRWTRPGLYLYLGESALQLVRLSGGWRPEVVMQAAFEFPVGAPLEVLPRVEAWLATHPARRRGERLCLTLGCVHVPVVLLPWSPELARDGFRRALAGALLERQLQKEAGAHEMVFGPLRFGEPLLAAFVARQLTSAWQALASRNGLRFVACRPLAGVVWNRFSSRLSGGNGQLVLVEDSRLLSLTRARGLPQRVGLRPVDADTLEAVARTAPTSIFAPDTLRAAAASQAPWLIVQDRHGRALPHAVACAVCGEM